MKKTPASSNGQSAFVAKSKTKFNAQEITKEGDEEKNFLELMMTLTFLTFMIATQVRHSDELSKLGQEKLDKVSLTRSQQDTERLYDSYRYNARNNFYIN